MRRIGFAWSMVVVPVCLSCAGTHALRPEWQAKDVPALKARMSASRSPLSSYSAEARLTYFGKEGRMRGTASIAAERPSRLRYELLGPHGGVLVAFATNGAEFSAVDFGQNKFFYGRATSHALDEILGVAPLHLDATAWVSLLFGEIAIPDEATLNYDAQRGLFVVTWTPEGETRQVWVEPESARVTEARVSRDGAVVTSVKVDDWHERGLPASLHLKVTASRDDVELKLRDVTYNPTLDAELFSLTPPRGAETVRVE